MGEAYRARDGRLSRDVAIKVLPSDVAADHGRLARFERETQVLASLNHPNIARIHGVDDSSGMPCAGHGTRRGPRVSPDGTRIAIVTDDQNAIWLGSGPGNADARPIRLRINC